MSAPRLEVVMVRHAHAEWVPDETRPLSERGLRDAERVAERLEDLALDAIYSSPYRRAVQTVEPLASAKGLEIRIVEKLHERVLADGAVPDFEQALIDSWADFEFRFPTGESHRQTLERFSRAFCRVIADHHDETIAIGTHGNALALLLHDFDSAYDYDFWHAMSWPDIYRLAIEEGEITGVERLWESERRGA